MMCCQTISRGMFVMLLQSAASQHEQRTQTRLVAHLKLSSESKHSMQLRNIGKTCLQAGTCIQYAMVYGKAR